MGLKSNAEPGDIYQGEDGALYKVVGYQPSPTVTLAKITMWDGEPIPPLSVQQETHAIDCLNAKPFTKIGTFDRKRPK